MVLASPRRRAKLCGVKTDARRLDFALFVGNDRTSRVRLSVNHAVLLGTKQFGVTEQHPVEKNAQVFGFAAGLQTTLNGEESKYPDIIEN